MWGIFNIRTADSIKYGKKVDELNDGIKESIVTVVGNMQELAIGAKYKFIAEPEFNNKYKSWQYNPSVVTPLAPKSREETVLFLQSVLTENQAKAITSEYPDIVNDVMNGKDNVDLAKLKGIGEKTWIKIKDKIINNFILVDLIALLMPHGITASAIATMLQTEHNPSLLKQKIEENPYFLTTIRGFGFAKVDKIAIQLNPSFRKSKQRAIAFTKYYLTDSAENAGDTYVNYKTIHAEAENVIPESIENFDELIESQRNDGKFLKIADDKIGLAKYFNIESNIYERLKEIEAAPFPFDITEEDIENGIVESEEEQGFKFSDEQKLIIREAFNHNVLLFTGGAGCGKTTISRAILNIYSKAECKVDACSLSAKAARRITEATGHEAQTIHRLLEYNGKVFNKTRVIR